MELDHRTGSDVPTWMLDTDYNGLVFHGSQVFFPRTSAWEHLKKALKATHEESVWDHLAGTESAPFEAGEHQQIAVKVIDDRGNELLVVKNLKEAATAEAMAENFEVATPILNGPFDPPQEHWKIEPDRPAVRMPGRRKAGISIVNPAHPPHEEGTIGAGDWAELELVNLVRERMAKWQADARPGLTRASAELIAYWRREGRKQRLFFAQLGGGRSGDLSERGPRRLSARHFHSGGRAERRT